MRNEHYTLYPQAAWVKENLISLIPLLVQRSSSEHSKISVSLKDPGYVSAEAARSAWIEFFICLVISSLCLFVRAYVIQLRCPRFDRSLCRPMDSAREAETALLRQDRLIHQLFSKFLVQEEKDCYLIIQLSQSCEIFFKRTIMNKVQKPIQFITQCTVVQLFLPQCF